ncbi:hypothetical protein Hanom_Chr00s000003g01602311 [Helianthus anomalus]
MVYFILITYEYYKNPIILVRACVMRRFIMGKKAMAPHSAPEHHYSGRYGGGKSWSRNRHSGVNICTIFPPLTHAYIYIHMYV